VAGRNGAGLGAELSEIITWTPTTAKLSDLQPWERNPKTISESHATRLLKNWKSLGQWQTLAIGPNGEVYDGHQRLSVLLAAYGPEYEVQVLQSSRPLTDTERGQIVFEGTVGAVGQVDWEVAASFPSELLTGWGLDEETQKGWSRDIAALDNFLKSEQAELVDAEPQIDRAAELLEKWQVKRGDLFAIGEHRLLCGDSTVRADVARVIGEEKAHMLFADAPYNTGETWSGLQEYRGNEQVKNDNIDNWQEWASGCFTLWLDCALGNDLAGYWWFGQRESPRAFLEKAGMYIRGHIVWVKENFNVGRADYHSQYEECQYFSKGERRYKGARNQSDVRTANRVEEERLHPTQKPLSLCAGLIEQHDSVIIFDPFGGSGTTMLACNGLDKQCRMIELEPKYCSVILQRMTDAFPALEIKRLD